MEANMNAAIFDLVSLAPPPLEGPGQPAIEQESAAGSEFLAELLALFLNMSTVRPEEPADASENKEEAKATAPPQDRRQLPPELVFRSEHLAEQPVRMKGSKTPPASIQAPAPVGPAVFLSSNATERVVAPFEVSPSLTEAQGPVLIEANSQPLIWKAQPGDEGLINLFQENPAPEPAQASHQLAPTVDQKQELNFGDRKDQTVASSLWAPNQMIAPAARLDDRNKGAQLRPSSVLSPIPVASPATRDSIVKVSQTSQGDAKEDGLRSGKAPFQPVFENLIVNESSAPPAVANDKTQSFVSLDPKAGQGLFEPQTGEPAPVETNHLPFEGRVNHARLDEAFSQVVQSARYLSWPDSKVFEVQLQPEFLGKVRIETTLDSDNVLSAHIEVENPEVKNFLESRVSALMEDFERAGLEVEAVKVHAMTLGVEADAARRHNPEGRAHAAPRMRPAAGSADSEEEPASALPTFNDGRIHFFA